VIGVGNKDGSVLVDFETWATCKTASNWLAYFQEEERFVRASFKTQGVDFDTIMRRAEAPAHGQTYRLRNSGRRIVVRVV